MEHNIAITLITFGGLLFLGLLTDVLGRRTKLPRVTLLLIFGFLIGPSCLDILPALGEKRFPAIADIALVMVGFLLGEKFTLSSLREYGRYVLWISVSVVIATSIIVFFGLILFGVRTDIALLLAGIACATAPAATVDVVREVGANGPFSKMLLGVVAVDDAWGMIVFSFLLAIVQTLNGNGGNMATLLFGVWEIGMSILVGIALGIPLAYLTGRIKDGEPTLVEALGAVFLCGGIAIWLEVSFILAAMVMGIVVANLARHHKRPFHAIEGIEWPVMILFFVLAGAMLHAKSLLQVGVIGTLYIIFRTGGRLIGGWIGGKISHTVPLYRKWIGTALMPQAGIALGLGLVAEQKLPGVGKTVLHIVIGATVWFEITGPIMTKIALNRVGETDTSK
ncbi:MAG: cation:proton antiporter [Candidatus Kuenenia sp.]|nr:cation:proton antiporter [Candidatus Kuenenia hertensis]